MYLLHGRPSAGYTQGTRPGQDRPVDVHSLPGNSYKLQLSALQGTPAWGAWGLGSPWQDLGEGGGAGGIPGEFRVGAGERGIPGRALASLMLPACQPQLLPGGFKTVSSSCFKFPGRGLQEGELQAVWGVGCYLPGPFVGCSSPGWRLPQLLPAGLSASPRSWG